MRHNHSYEFQQAGEHIYMDTSGFDKQAQSHLSFYHGFMNGVKIVIVLIILTLVGMAIPRL